MGDADIPFLYLKPADFRFDFLLFWKWNHRYLFNYNCLSEKTQGLNLLQTMT